MLTAQQKKERRKGIGGSDIPVIFGISKYQTPDGLMAEKRGIFENDDNIVDSIGDAARGDAMEPYIRKLYQHDKNILVQQCGTLWSREYRLLFAHLDGIVPPYDDLTGPGVLEIKCPRPIRYRAIMIDGAPEEWNLQVQHYLIVTGYKWADLIMFNCDDWNYEIFHIKPDYDLQGDIINEARTFWDAMQNDKPFHPLGSQQKQKRITEGEMPEYDPMIETEIQSYLDNRNLMQFYNYAHDYNKAELLSMMGDYSLLRTELYTVKKTLVNSKNPYYKLTVSVRKKD